MYFNQNERKEDLVKALINAITKLLNQILKQIKNKKN